MATRQSEVRSSREQAYDRGVRALVVVLALSFAASARAQLTAPLSIALGEGVSVEAVGASLVWEPRGFTFGDESGLVFAATFARTGSGRIVAVAPHAGIGGCAFLFTDDLGAHWSAVAWPVSDPWTPTAADCRGSTAASRPSRYRPLVLAFDPGSRHGVATTYDGRVLSTEDDGAHWVVRRTGTPGIVSAWVRGHTAVFLDGRGQLWRSPDGGFAFETIGDPVGRVEVAGAELRMYQGDRLLGRVDGRGLEHAR